MLANWAACETHVQERLRDKYNANINEIIMQVFPYEKILKKMTYKIAYIIRKPQRYNSYGRTILPFMGPSKTITHNMSFIRN
jgi:hypothetical protein